MITIFKNWIRDVRDRRQLVGLQLAHQPEFELRSLTASQLRDALAHETEGDSWRKWHTRIADLVIPEAAGGVNLGDQRALFSLISTLKPARVLEVGTHIGASTVHIAAALSSLRANNDISTQFTTVDIVDVNDSAIRQWEKFSAPRSPFENLKCLEIEESVKFEVSDSAEFLRQSETTYDFIFLDGDHSAKTVFIELPLALSALAPGGAILLHDYFPENRALWKDGNRIPGPWRAVRKLRSELEFDVLPLGVLPWPTKLGSSTTSLALVVAAEK